MRPRAEWCIVLGALLVGIALVILRRPDAVFHARFVAEDGAVWYAQAYNLGVWHALLIPYVSYLATIPRLVAGLALLVPLQWAPLVMNLAAIIIQATPVAFLMSGRMEELIPSPWARGGLAILYVAMPNSFETDANITNAQWHLAVLVFLIVIAAEPRSLAARIFDGAILVLSGLSGPFGVCLLPIAGLVAWSERTRPRFTTLAAVAIPAMVQLSLIVTLHAQRVATPLGASVPLLLRIIGGQVVLASLVGVKEFTALQALLVSQGGRLEIIAASVGLVLFAYTGMQAAPALRLLLLYAALILATALYTPQVSATTPQWHVMASPGIAPRYYSLPALALAASSVWCVAKRSLLPIRVVAGIALVALLTVGIPKDWRYPPIVDVGFDRSVAVFASAKPGETVSIPIFPPGWHAVLVKH